MKTLIRIVQFSLLVFAISPFTAQAAPAAPTLTSPKGMLTSQPPVFKWDALFDATWYRIWVKDESGVVIAKWVKSTEVCNIVGDGLCEYSPGIGTEGAAVWQVRGYDGSELGAWSARAKFFDSLSPPGPASLLEPLTSTTNPTPTFKWSLVPEATWYKIELVDSIGQSIVSQWLRADSNNVDCDPNLNECSKTPMADIPDDFVWRIRTYNSAGLGPWTAGEPVVIIPGSPLSAMPNPLTLGLCSDFTDYEFMVSNDSNDTVTGIDVLNSVGDFILGDSDGSSDIECEDEVSTLAPGESCVITKSYSGDTALPAFSTMSVTVDGIAAPLDIEIEVTSNNCF